MQGVIRSPLGGMTTKDIPLFLHVSIQTASDMCCINRILSPHPFPLNDLPSCMKLYIQSRHSARFFPLCDSPPVTAFSSLLSVSGHFLSPLLVDLVTVCWQGQEDSCGELTTARANQYRNINELAVLGSRDSGKLEQLSPVHSWKLVKDGNYKALLGKFASLRLNPCQCYLIWGFFFFFHRNLAA